MLKCREGEDFRTQGLSLHASCEASDDLPKGTESNLNPTLIT